uniref:Uncharacterized protein isoform X2 n=1 Tax=Nicotiana tabacum TaxID=4097 RepID=A0A1S3X585_TOBAC|nr:PREDICTED: uncharacterized protein LOC107761294 isoform X2 [Nicotiana tabacum]
MLQISKLTQLLQISPPPSANPLTIMAEKGSNTSTSNSTEGGNSMNHDGELNNEAQDSERPVDKELQADLDRQNGKEVGGVSQEDLTAESSQEVKNEKSENHCSSTDHDPMLDPSSTLQAVKETLERGRSVVLVEYSNNRSVVLVEYSNNRSVVLVEYSNNRSVVLVEYSNKVLLLS